MPEDREQRTWSRQSWAESSVYCSILIQLPSWWRKTRCACPIHLTGLLKGLAESFCQYQGIYISFPLSDFASASPPMLETWSFYFSGSMLFCLYSNSNYKEIPRRPWTQLNYPPGKQGWQHLPGQSAGRDKQSIVSVLAQQLACHQRS